jgi:hypothetical protein
MNAAFAHLLFVLPVALVAAAPQPPALQPVKQAGQLLLFDAGRHDLKLVNHYTARWKTDSNLTPSAHAVQQDGATWLELRFHGQRGMACSTLFFQPPPAADPGLIYRGLELELDCEREDYPHIGVQVVFTDKSQLTHDLTLERGRHTYLVERGFRREKNAPRWELLSHVMLTLDAARQSPDLVYRLRRITMRQVKSTPDAWADDARVPDQFAEKILSPRPKQLAWQDGTFIARPDKPLWVEKNATPRTRRTVEIFADQYAQFTGVRPNIKTFDVTTPDSGIVLRVARSAAGARAEGYALTVAPDRVLLEGADEPGLYYATVTFFQLVRHALKRPADGLAVPCARVVDWPDAPHRMIRLEHPHTFRNYPVRENRGIDYLIDWTERYVAGNKFNLFYIDFSANVRYGRRPEFNGSEKIYSLDDLRRFGQYCRDRFIDLCPAWQIGGHANWWLTIGYHPELREKGWPSQADVTHPEHDAIVRDCMLDVIEALQPRYLSPKSDEWWHERKPDETPDALLHGRTPAQAFLESHLRLHQWLQARGITMMIYEDMLTPYHNGKRFDTYRVLDSMPKDVIFTLWSGGHPETEIRYFTERGFRVWPNATGMFTLSAESKRRVMGFGKGLYSFGNDKSHLLDEYSPLWSLSNLLRVADYAWNFAEDEKVDPGRLVALEQLLALRPKPRAGSRVEPIDLGLALAHDFNTLVKQWQPERFAQQARPVSLPRGTRDVGFIPTRLSSAGHDCLALSKDSRPVALPVRGRYASLVFLHSAYVNDPHDKAVSGVRIRDWMYGWPCGNYVVRYADGSRAVLPVRLTMNVKRFDTASFTRSALDNRYTWSIDAADGRPVHLFQWEWVNPRPDAEIVGVDAEHDHLLDVTLVLFAVSGRPAAPPSATSAPKPKAGVPDVYRQAWRTHLVLTTDRNGQARFRGFQGKYAIELTSPHGNRSFTLELKDGTAVERFILKP